MDAQQQNISAKFYKNNPSLFIFTKFSMEKINVGKFLKLWENCCFIFNFNHILKSKNFKVWHRTIDLFRNWWRHRRDWDILQAVCRHHKLTSIHPRFPWYFEGYLSLASIPFIAYVNNCDGEIYSLTLPAILQASRRTSCGLMEVTKWLSRCQ